MVLNSIQSFLEHYESIRKRTNRLLHSIPPDQSEFSYKPGKFTIADQVRHIAAVERYMFAETIAGRKSSYTHCGKEMADGWENVLQLFHALHEESITIIKTLYDEDLERNCLTPAGVPINTGKWLLLLAEHEIHHRAELYIYLNLLNVRTPPMYGLTSEELAALGK